MRQNFRGFLKAGSTEQPFLYWWGPTNTHRTWVQGSGKKFWNINPDELRGKLPGHLPDVAEVREDVADYLGEVQALDAGLRHSCRCSTTPDFPATRLLWFQGITECRVFRAGSAIFTIWEPTCRWLSPVRAAFPVVGWWRIL
ncbi:MAG UNVERIFIED_CONTAM: hypothetical protein LVR18_47595 [Planctomycetaceae bacterium]